MKTLLIMTVGQTDVQLVLGDQRHKFDGNTCGTLHDAIKKRSWSVVDAPSQRSRDLIKDLPKGAVTLCTPKLNAVLNRISEMQSTPITSVLIFETNRQNPRDPRLAGEVLERRLRDRGVNHVVRVAFLTGTEQLEDPSNDVDAVVRRTVVARLWDAIRKQVGPLTKTDKVFVAPTGGLDAANQLIQELVRLHAVGGPAVTTLEVPDLDRTGQDDRAVEERLHPAASYRARWHALSLIEKGNLLAAWGAVQHLESEPTAKHWTQVVEWLKCFASSLPMPKSCDIPMLTHKRLAVRAALHVELALRAGDIPRAVHGTVAFVEAAFWDWIREYDFIAEGITKASEDEYHLPQTPSDDQKRRFRKQKKKGCWRINDYRTGIAAWLRKLNKPALQELWDTLTDNIWKLRHDVAHNEPTPALMNEGRDRMQEASLWSDQDTFLTQHLIQGVLCELGVQNPKNLVDDLMSTIRSRLQSS